MLNDTVSYIIPREAAEFYCNASKLVAESESGPLLEKQAVCYTQQKEWDLAFQTYERGKNVPELHYCTNSKLPDLPNRD